MCQECSDAGRVLDDREVDKHLLQGVLDSIYRWKGRVCSDGEMLLIIKTVAGEFEGVRETIQKVNTYELPEVLAYRVDHASDPFGDWIARMTERPKKRVAAARSKPRRPSAAATPPPG